MRNPNKTLAGILAGVGGGVVMAAALGAHSSVTGNGFWLPMQYIAVTFFGKDAIWNPATAPIGLLTHLIVSGALGVFFTRYVSTDTPLEMALLRGATFGFFAWILVTYLLLPLVNPLMSDSIHQSLGLWLTTHFMFGVALGAVPALERALSPLLRRKWT